MEHKKKELSSIPSVADLERELKRENYQRRYVGTVIHIIYTLITVAALSVLISTLFLPVLRIYGTSMEPTVVHGDIVVAVKTEKLEKGDIVAFWLNNKILVKRVIAESGDWVDIDEDGNVYVNDEAVEENYLGEKALGECDIELPYQVADGRMFVMGDHRLTSLDSRSSEIGGVTEEQIVGKVKLRVWPIRSFGVIR